jgi:hypothetical protein
VTGESEMLLRLPTGLLLLLETPQGASLALAHSFIVFGARLLRCTQSHVHNWYPVVINGRASAVRVDLIGKAQCRVEVVAGRTWSDRGIAALSTIVVIDSLRCAVLVFHRRIACFVCVRTLANI